MHVHSSLRPARTGWIMFHLPDKQIKQHVGTTLCLLFIVDQNLCITGCNDSLVLNNVLKSSLKKETPLDVPVLHRHLSSDF